MKKRAPHKSISIVKRISVTNIVTFLIVSVFSILGTVLLNLHYHINRDANMMNVYISNTLNSVDDKLKDMGRVSLIAFSDQRVQEIVSGSGYTYEEERENEKYLKNLYSSLITIRDDIRGIYIFNLENMIFYNDSASPMLGLDWNVDSFFDEVRENSDSETNISGCHLYMDGLPEGFRYESSYTGDIFQKNNIYLVRPIRSFSPFEVIGYIAIRTPIRSIANICDEYLEEDISYILADENGKIVCCSEQERIGESMLASEQDMLENITEKKGSFTTKKDGENYLYSYEVSDYSNMRLITAKSYRSIYEGIHALLFWCILLAVVCALVVLVSVSALTRKNLKGLTDFSVDMQNFQPDNLIRRYEITCMDEIGVLKASFNKMMGRINDLVIAQYQAKDKLQKAEISEQKMAMLYLKQQINPHFLYNTLDMIRLKAAMNKDAQVSDMLMKLVQFYRLSTQAHLSMVTVQKEADMLEAYMSLMCYRYPELQYHAEISAEVLDMEIPNFTLQPLLENSLLHGLKDKRYRGSIILKIRKERQDEISIWIIDDGVGMSEEKLEELNTYGKADGENLYRRQLEAQGEAEHLGVVNVIGRLKLCCQNGCEIHYSRNEAGGTSVYIRMKAEREE